MAGELGVHLVSYEDEDMAKRVCAYLVKEFPYCKDSKTQVFVNPTPKAEREKFGDTAKYSLPYWYAHTYIVGILEGGEYWGKFTTSVERVTQAAEDYLAGYRAAKKGE